ncbi:hypothetical protein MKK88_05460 [Methylobacterium sp. E-005]|uniref:hypothetical protein n=1 Tax=Methylobacterium sp. E-005 TaxID=2836549 RepID=UPI001FB92744|nr:hypothetical protein [Methylobacterium sp. E-005]MCJ2085441.1 hypothetical protein [Methylobacterium sp. E-005]
MPQRNHGLLTCSQHSIDGAAFWFIALARACQRQLLVEATGIRPQLLSEKTARYSREHVASADIGWLHLRTLYGHIAETRPDMFAQGANPARGPVGCAGPRFRSVGQGEAVSPGPVCPESWRRAQSAAVFMVISLDRSTIVPAPCEPADQE